MMKQRKKKYLITFYTQIDDDFIDKRQIILKNKYNATKMYDKIASEQKTVSIEMEEIWNTPQSTEYQSTTLVKSFY